MGWFSRRHLPHTRRGRLRPGAEDLEGRALLSVNFWQQIGNNITSEWHKITDVKKHDHVLGISINLEPHQNKGHGL